FFFFQAEDGIRDLYVTGVQTCALPISSWNTRSLGFARDDRALVDDGVVVTLAIGQSFFSSTVFLVTSAAEAGLGGFLNRRAGKPCATQRQHRSSSPLKGNPKNNSPNHYSVEQAIRS